MIIFWSILIIFSSDRWKVWWGYDGWVRKSYAAKEWCSCSYYNVQYIWIWNCTLLNMKLHTFTLLEYLLCWYSWCFLLILQWYFCDSDERWDTFTWRCWTFPPLNVRSKAGRREEERCGVFIHTLPLAHLDADIIAGRGWAWTPVRPVCPVGIDCEQRVWGQPGDTLYTLQPPLPIHI